MKKRFLILISIFFLSFVFAQKSAGINDLQKEWPNAVMLEEGLMGGGKPTEKALELAVKKGFKTIIDLRTLEEGTASEEALVKEYGLNYFNIPTSAENFSKKHGAKLNDILSKPNIKPAILHCASGNRAAAVWAVYRKFYQGESASEVFTRASAKGLRSSLKARLTTILTA